MLERTKKQELTNRQLEVLSLLRKGLTNGEICRILNISENTVKIHLANIYRILEVSNRTEAAAAEFSQACKDSSDVCVYFAHDDEDIKRSPLAHKLFLSIVDALRSYRLFQIKFCQLSEKELLEQGTYQIRISATQDEQQSLFISLYQGDNSALIWSVLQKIENAEQIQLFTYQITIQLYRQMMLSATNIYSRNPNAQPYWWYATSYATIKMENRSQEEFSACEKELQSLLDSKGNKDYIYFVLACTYYTAIAEHWGDSDLFAKKIEEIACSTMRETPSSTNSMYCMALHNILIGNKNEAAVYLEGILINNPLCVKSRRLLAQIYMLVGREDDALFQLNEYQRFVPNSIEQAFQFVAKAFIYFLQGKMDHCEEVSKQVLMFHPESPFARLFLIICLGLKGMTDERLEQIKLFYKYHPNFTKKDIDRFIEGISPSKKEIFEGYLDKFLGSGTKSII